MSYKLKDNKKNLNTVLNTNLTLISIFFIGFIVAGIVLLNLILNESIKFEENYLILVHILSAYIGMYLFNYILTDEKSLLKALLSPRIIFSISLILLIYTIVYIVIGDKETAEKLSLNIYYTMIIGIILEIIYIILDKYNINILQLDKKVDVNQSIIINAKLDKLHKNIYKKIKKIF